VKTASQMTAVLFILFFQSLRDLLHLTAGAGTLLLIGNILVWTAALFTVISGAVYMKENLHFISTTK
jgi:phosphatidylglycerophosphate synthase